MFVKAVSVCCLACFTQASQADIGAASPTERAEIIADAINHGAHIVNCSGNMCIDEANGHIVGPGPAGTFLMYPNDSEHVDAIAETRKKLSAAQ